MASPVENPSGTVPNKPAGRGVGRLFLDATAEGVLNFVLFIFRFVWWCAEWSFATVFFVAVMAGAGYYVFTEALSGGDPVRIPNVARRHVTDASYMLAERGLEMGKLKEMPDDRVPKGHVIAQRPPAGRVVRTGRKVDLTVSAGTQMMVAPNFLRRTLKDARDEIQQLPFAMGTVARIAHPKQRDTIIAQDPSPPARVLRGGKIHFLVSEGPSPLSSFMPDLRGKPAEDVQRILAPLGVLPIPKRVEEGPPDVEQDIVFDQRPPVGTVIHKGETVYYYVWASGEVSLPDARRRVEVAYTVPQLTQPCELRIDVIRDGERETRFPRRQDYVDGAPPKLVSGQTVTLQDEPFVDEMTVEIFLDGEKVQSHYYKGDARPVITLHGDVGRAGAPSQ